MRRGGISLVGATVVALWPLTAMAETQTPTATPAPSGIEGTIFVSPSRPGPIRKDTPTSAPARDVLFVVKSDDATVKSFTTDTEGRFQVALPPGHYVIMREDAGSRIGHWRFEADVGAGEMTKVKWTGDSGMR